MKEIRSFQIDHTTLERGIYVSRSDHFGGGDIVTYDIRMKAPYRDIPLRSATAHTLEHFLATYLRNARNDIVYVGPMGCMTGFYVVVYGGEGIDRSLADALRWVLTQDEVPGATKVQCGNYTFMDLEDAKKEARAFLNSI